MAARVSVITIFLDEERFLGEAIASVGAQSFEDWELVLVDDGSSDRSAEIARAAVAADPTRVRYVRHPGGANRGMSASRNLGIASSTGELIAFIDGDDVWQPAKLAEQLDVLDREPEAGMVYGRTRIWHEWRDRAPDRDYFYPLGVEPDRLYRPPALFPVLVRNRAQTPTTINAMVRRDVVERVGGFVDSFRGMYEDQVFFAKVHLAAATYVDHRVWVLYRQHERSCSARSAAAEVDLDARRAFLDWLEGYVHAQGTSGIDTRLPLALARLDYHRLRARAWVARRLGRSAVP